MKHHRRHSSSAAERFVNVTGKLPNLSSKNLNRLSVFLIKDNSVLSESPLGSHGTFQFHIAPDLANHSGVYAVLGPKGMDAQSLASHGDLPAVAITSAEKHDRGGIKLEFAGSEINDELIDRWWIWCREYTVSGTLLTSSGCPMGAEVTVYNVTSGVSGLIKTPLETVTTDSNGNFTFSFNWCSLRYCWWPCWPVWWRCWPWWWELDILAVIENLERGVLAKTGTGINVAPVNTAPLRQPVAADLMTGVGFAGSRAAEALQPDSARTSLIASKFANPGLRELFPWWWWCCENPNIVFSATQGTTVVLDEDPNTSTRWCFASGQSVSLTGNSQSIGACQIQTGGPCGFSWSTVGSEPGVLIDTISMGYAEGSEGEACSNLAFAGTLNLNGVFGGDCTAFYQVMAGEWGGGASGLATAGNPARGGTSPVTAEPLSVPLYDWITIWGPSGFSQQQVLLGPCSFMGIDNLYISRSLRQNPPAGVTGLPPFPTIAAGDLWGWNAPDLVLAAPAADLTGASGAGGVTLSVKPYDVAGNTLPTGTQPYEFGPDLTLMIDTTGLAQATIDWHPDVNVSGVYNADGTPAMQTTGSSNTCPAYQITGGSGYVLLHTTVIDSAANLGEYEIVVQYGNGTLPPLSIHPSDRDYAQAPSSFTAPTAPTRAVDAGYGLPDNLPMPAPMPAPPAPGSAYSTAAPGNWTFAGGGDTFYIPITVSCCYDFQLWVNKRTTDGQTFRCAQGNVAYQTVNITVVPVP
jgi:hypothetical protein